MTDSAQTKETFDQLVDSAIKAAHAYYTTGESIMPDSEYDTLIDEIISLKEQYPDWDDRGVTTKVASGAVAAGSVKHPTPMLSMGKQRDRDALAKFAPGMATLVEPKLDGMAVRASYVDGKMILAATRGDGLTGEDITLQVKRGVTGLPVSLGSKFTGDVRGEIYMSDVDFDQANDIRVASGKSAFANPRNATAGTLRDADPDLRIPLSFAAYDVVSDDLTDDSYRSQMDTVSSLGIQTAVQLVEGLADMPVLAALDELESQRPTLGFPIDGAVVKVDSISNRQSLGENSRVPRWAVAFKFAADTAVTTIRDIEMSVGRTGRIGFRFVVDPVFVGGATVTYATAHNAPWIVANDLRIGDRVWIYRSGDVIPRITTPIVADRTSDVVPWEPPTTCPQCGMPLDTSSVVWSCTTPSCSTVGRIVYAASRDCLDIEGLDTAIAEALVDSGMVSDISDLYGLTVEQLTSLHLAENRQVGAKVATKLISSIEASKQQPFHRVLTALGIRSTGRRMSAKLAEHFKTMKNLQAATVADITNIDSLGESKAKDIVAGLASMKDVIESLSNYGLTMSQVESTGPKPLAGGTYVVSGAVPGYTRTTIDERITELGGKVSSSVSKTTTALITNETDTSKAQKAAQLGVKIIDPAEFVAQIDG